MGNIGELYKIYYKIVQTEKEEENREEFSAIALRIRNRNKDGSYRFYDENGNTVSIQAKHLNGIFMDNALMSSQPSISCYIITEDKDMFELVTGVVPPKDKEEEEGLANLKQQMKFVVEDSLTKFIESIKKATECISVEEPVLAQEEVEVKETCGVGCGHVHH